MLSLVLTQYMNIFIATFIIKQNSLLFKRQWSFYHFTQHFIFLFFFCSNFTFFRYNKIRTLLRIFMKIQWKTLLLFIFLPLFLGFLSSQLISSNVVLYDTLILPPFSPPAFLFPIVWTILYILMGISSYLIFVSDHPMKKSGLILYGIQLFLNFIWSHIFFHLQMYGLAFLILVLLFIVVLLMTKHFFNISPIAGLLQIPYILWLVIAGYLNLTILLLNV